MIFSSLVDVNRTVMLIFVAIMSVVMLLVLGLSDFLPLSEPALKTISESNSSSVSGQENRNNQRYAEDTNHDLLQGKEVELHSLEQHPLPSAAILTPSIPLPAVSPIQLSEGTTMPWAWIEKLDPAKLDLVEKAFDEAARIAASRMPAEPGYNDSSFETLQPDVSSDLAVRLRSILSPKEFEAYLSSLPTDLRVQIESQLLINR